MKKLTFPHQRKRNEEKAFPRNSCIARYREKTIIYPSFERNIEILIFPPESAVFVTLYIHILLFLMNKLYKKSISNKMKIGIFV